MERKPFQFKQFSIRDQYSALKLNTDGVLLGSWANIQPKGNLLDIGTGCGILALMAAQKAIIEITAIDPDEGSVIDSYKNFQNSPWKSQLKVRRISIQHFAQQSNIQFSQIISNPPYFTNSLKSPYDKVNLSKHNDSLSQLELIDAVYKLLLPEGLFFTILPVSEYSQFVILAHEKKLHIQKLLKVIPKKGKQVNRMLIEIVKNKTKKCITDQLIIRNEDGSFTNEYKVMTQDFYL